MSPPHRFTKQPRDKSVAVDSEELRQQLVQVAPAGTGLMMKVAAVERCFS